MEEAYIDAKTSSDKVRLHNCNHNDQQQQKQQKINNNGSLYPEIVNFAFHPKAFLTSQVRIQMENDFAVAANHSQL
jgi:hypothetical protein